MSNRGGPAGHASQSQQDHSSSIRAMPPNRILIRPQSCEDEVLTQGRTKRKNGNFTKPATPWLPGSNPAADRPHKEVSINPPGAIARGERFDSGKEERVHNGIDYFKAPTHLHDGGQGSRPIDLWASPSPEKKSDIKQATRLAPPTWITSYVGTLKRAPWGRWPLRIGEEPRFSRQRNPGSTRF